jgi:BirA family biotin operon repressor/biotin-[acetyl-CoA-carboxylase] ligase
MDTLFNQNTDFDQNTILQAIQTKWAGKTVHFAKETDSTNLWIKKLAKEGAAHGTLAVAEFQSAGRGRFDRKWTAPSGSSVTMTILLRPDFAPRYASMLTLVMGLSVAQMTEKLGLSAGIKWPNDVVLSKKKICGILTEMGIRGDGIDYVEIGVGINVNLTEFPEEMADKATSLCLEAGRNFDRNQIIACVLEFFEQNYERFTETCDLSQLKEEYERLLVNQGQPVRVLDLNHPYEGICLGVNSKGELLVKKADGNVCQVSAGEVSVRGLYSYV